MLGGLSCSYTSGECQYRQGATCCSSGKYSMIVRRPADAEAEASDRHLDDQAATVKRLVSVLPAPFWPAPSPRLKVRPRCRDEPRQPSPNLSSPRQTNRESRDSPAPRTPRVCLGAQSQAPRQTTPPQKFADAVPSRPTHPRSSPTTSTILSRLRRKFGALVKPPARPPQNPCNPVHP